MKTNVKKEDSIIEEDKQKEIKEKKKQNRKFYFINLKLKL